jgi:hypothetical protein
MHRSKIGAWFDQLVPSTWVACSTTAVQPA